ncbi:MAG: MarR family transcriptional regulator, partial [Nitrososphaerota archaeon]
SVPINLLSLFLGAIMTGAFYKLYIVGAWHRKPIEVYTTGIKVGNRFASWQEIREIDHTEATELTDLGPYNYPMRYQTVYHVFVELRDGTELRFRLKERDFNKFVRAVAVLAVAVTILLFRGRRRAGGGRSSDVVRYLESRGGEALQSEIARDLGLSKSTASYLLQGLEASGLIVRERRGRDVVVRLRK